MFASLNDQEVEDIEVEEIAAENHLSLASQTESSSDSGDPGSETEQLRRQLQQTNEQLEALAVQSNQLVLELELTRLELRQIFENSNDAMAVIDTNHIVQRVNHAMLTRTEKSRQELLGQKCRDVFHGDLCDTDECPYKKIKKGAQRFEKDLRYSFVRGKEGHYLLSASRFDGVTGEMAGVIIGLKDITARKKAEADLKSANEKLERLATIDGLTQISNRRHFDERLNLDWQRSQRNQGYLSLILGDIDFFKRYNDHYGHQAGDDCLKQVACRLKHCARRPADLAARYGGEEFVLLLPETDPDGAMVVAESLRQSLKDLSIAHAHSDAASYVTMSMGVASVIPSASNRPKDLIECADAALYESKDGGRNRATLKKLSNG